MHEELLQEFLLHLRIKRMTISYFYKMREFNNYCAENSLDMLNVTHKNISEFLYMLATVKHLQPQSVNGFIKAFRFFYRYLATPGIEKIDEKMLEMVLSFKQLPEDTTVKHYIDEDTFLDMVHSCLKYDHAMTPIKRKAILYFLFYTGVRPKELITLTRDRINLAEKKALIVKTKNREDNYVFFNDKTTEAIMRYFKTEPEVENAFNLTYDKLKYLFLFLKEFIDNPNIKVTPYLLRHSFANYMVEKGCDVRSLQYLMRHKSIDSTLIYYNIDKKRAERKYRECTKAVQ